jgi:enolase
MPTLTGLKARQVLDSRGRPTVEVDALGSTGARGRAIVPSGASTGRHEALELRDKDRARYGGLGVLKAVENVTNVIGPAIAGMDLNDQAAIDAKLIELDGTPNKGRLGANAILGVSLAVAHAGAAANGEELFVYLNRVWRLRDTVAHHSAASVVSPALPMPMVNMISGGLHAGGNLDIQDVLTIPVAAKTYSEALEMTVALYRAVGSVLAKQGFEASLVGDEGGYGPRLRDNEQAMAVVVDAIRLAGYEPGRDVAIALDVASSHFFDPASGTYRLGTGRAQTLDMAGMIDLLAGWVDRFPIVSLEDGLAEDDWEGWIELTQRLGKSVQLIGDDLFATQIARLRAGIDRGAGNAILIKLNQVGTLTETFDAIALAQDHGFRTVVSARSGETEDATIADLAVATGAGQIKIGSVARSERLAKYNRLLRIEEELGTNRFSGWP